MPSFLASLLILISGFALGKPVDHPPVIPVELDQRGHEVSDLVGHKPTISPTLTATPKPEENNEPDIDKVPAYNNRSDKEMPTNLPQNAIDHSQALEAVTGPGVEVDYDTIDIPPYPPVLVIPDHKAPDVIPPDEITTDPLIIENEHPGNSGGAQEAPNLGHFIPF